MRCVLMGEVRGKVQVRVGSFKTKANPKSVEARIKHGDVVGGDPLAKGTQLGVKGSGLKKREK